METDKIKQRKAFLDSYWSVQWSRAPKHHRNRIDPETVKRLVEYSEKHGWGAKEVRQILTREHPDVRLPVVSTVNGILDRHGLVKKRRSRNQWQHPGAVPLETDRPKQVLTDGLQGVVQDVHHGVLLPVHGDRPCQP